MASFIPYFEFEVASHSVNNIHKWKADGELSQNIFLSTSVEERELWRFEREENEPLWSFHILSDAGNKLYVSYDEDNDVDDVTLELKNDESGKKRLFMIFLQNNDQYLFRAYNSTDRYLRWVHENGRLKLEMVITKHPSEDMLWMVKEDFTQVQLQSKHNVVEVYNDNEKWISSGAQEGQPVKVHQNGSPEEWKLIKNWEGNTETWMFSLTTRNAFSASSVSGIDEILFEGEVSDSNTKWYQPKGFGTRRKLKNLASGKWLAVGPMSHLSQVEIEKYSVWWDIPNSRFSYVRSGRVHFFPPLRTCSVDEKKENNLLKCVVL